MKYEEEFRNATDIDSFIKNCRRKWRTYEGISDATFKRRFYDLQKKLGPKPKPRKKINTKKLTKEYDTKVIKNNIKSTIDYEKIFTYSKNYKDFAKRVINIKPTMKLSSAKRRYYEVKQIVENKNKELEKQKLYTPPTEIKTVEEEREEYYTNEEKVKPSHLKIIEFNDMKKLHKGTINREFLQRYGFNNYEINWLIDSGENIYG